MRFNQPTIVLPMSLLKPWPALSARCRYLACDARDLVDDDWNREPGDIPICLSLVIIVHMSKQTTAMPHTQMPFGPFHIA